MRYRPECPLPRPDRHSSCQTGLPLQLASKKTNHGRPEDRKSTRLNSSHDQISYAVFCLKKKKKQPPDSPGKIVRPSAVYGMEEVVGWSPNPAFSRVSQRRISGTMAIGCLVS